MEKIISLRGIDSKLSMSTSKRISIQGAIMAAKNLLDENCKLN